MSTSTEAQAPPGMHTLGPWRAIKGTGYINAPGVNVAIVGAYRDKELLPLNRDRWDADARLIAAAPDLLTALRPFANMAATLFKGTLYENGEPEKVVLVHHETGVQVTLADFTAALDAVALAVAGKGPTA